MMAPALGGAVFGVAYGTVLWWPSPALWSAYAFFGGSVLGLLVGFAFWLVSDIWNRPLAVAADVTPHSIYRKDFQTRLMSGLLLGLVGGLVVGLVLGLPFLREAGLEDALYLGLESVLIVGPIIGLLGGLWDGAAPRLLCTEIAFLLRGRPVRFIRLLEEARERQVLRQAGAVYQFRHADLQDRLANRHPT